MWIMTKDGWRQLSPKEFTPMPKEREEFQGVILMHGKWWGFRGGK